MEKILIFEAQKKRTPTVTAFLELINYALEKRPNMTLAEFAREINEVEKEKALERIQRAEKRQYGSVDVNTEVDYGDFKETYGEFRNLYYD